VLKAERKKAEAAIKEAKIPLFYRWLCGAA
jgi:hypothetical protein